MQPGEEYLMMFLVFTAPYILPGALIAVLGYLWWERRLHHASAKKGVVLMKKETANEGHTFHFAPTRFGMSHAFQENAEMRNAVTTVSGGVFKRIDENRELLELIKDSAPELLAQYPYIEGWIASHDHFFTELARLSGTPNVFSERPGLSYPRPWPGKRSV